jgi:type I restriction enzyme S subunit
MAIGTLAELCTLVTDGTHDSPRLLNNGIPFIKGKHISRGFVDFEHCDFISRDDHQKVISRSKPEFGDTLFANIGNSIGDAAYVSTSREFSIKNVALFKPNPKFVNSRYLYYHVISRSFQDSMLVKKSGSAQPFLGLDTLRNHLIQYHVDLQQQGRIASILSAYDDLIENNTRRIEILEQMAQMLYREWFVNLRFPGHEKVTMVESELGQIPEDWNIEPIANVAEILGGGTPATGAPEYWQDGDIDWYSPTDLTATNSMFMFGSSKKITALGLKKSSARLFPPDSVMMTSRATIGVVSINRGAACTNQGFITCVPGSRVSPFQIYFWLLENKEKITNLATGATFKEINKRTFRELPIVVPSPEVLTRFAKTVSPICGLIENLLRRRNILRTTRDLLLPRLVSGEVNVEQIEQEVLAEVV